MFYSLDEISIMSKSHGDDLRRACRNCRNKKETVSSESGFRKKIIAVMMIFTRNK